MATIAIAWFPTDARAACTVSPDDSSVLNCTGDNAAGITVNNGSGPLQTLNVFDLTTNIAPASGTTGILFTSNGAVEVNIDAGAFAVHTDNANGIFAAASVAGAVTIISTADFVTTGGGATGIEGSGQNDLLTITSSGNITTSGNNAFGIAAGTVKGDVIVHSSGSIATSGTFAAGINVGTIGQSGTDTGHIRIVSTGDITTSGISANGVNAASVYGSIDITSLADITVSGNSSVGISAATNGDVRITAARKIETMGADSSGVSARAAGDILITSSGDISTHGDDTDLNPNSPIGAIVAESQSGDVDIASTGTIKTDGVGVFGIYADAAGIAMVMSGGSITTHGDGAAAISASGDSGAVVLSTSNIRTFGASAPGITVVSIGDAGVVSSGSITTTGDSSDGITVVSSSGTAAVVNSGRISATGTGSAGIYAAGYTGSIVMNSGTVVGGACCAGVMMDSAAFNQLTNWGTITAGLADFAVDLMAPSNTVDNYGTITGDIRLFDGFDPAGSFNNHAGGTVNSGSILEAAFVLNDGTLAPGGRGIIKYTLIGDPASAVSAQYIQGQTGTLAIDVDAANATSDAIGVAGSAELAGKVDVSVTSLPTTPAQSFLIVATNDGVTNNGLTVSASPALHATLSYPNATDVVLGIAVDFDVDQLNRNQRAIARGLDRILAAGGGGVTPVLLGLLNVDDLSEYRSALNQLSPEIYSDAQISALYSSLAFSNSLLSCKVNGTDTASIIREGQCLWAGASARFLDTGTTSQQIGFTEDAGLFTAGAQVALDDNWRLGAAAGYQSSTIETATGATSSGSLGQAGLAVKYNPGPLLLAAAISGGGGQYDTHRPMSFAGFGGIADGTQDLGVFAGTFRAAYVFGSPSLYFKPTIDAALTRLQLSGFTEEGGNGAALTAEGQGQTVFSLAPTLETGTEWWLGNGTLVRPLIRAGAIWYDNANFALTASFADAPAGVAPFTIHTGIDDVMGIAAAGVDIINQSGAVLRFSYEGQFGETTQIHAVGIKGSARF